MSERDGFTSRYENAQGCLSVIALPFYVLAKIPFFLAAEARRYELESMLAEEKIPARDLVFLESEFHVKINKYVGAVYKTRDEIPLKKHMREYDPDVWLIEFFKARQAYWIYLPEGKPQGQLQELEELVRYDAYYQILERKGIVELAEKKVSDQKNE